VEQIEKAMEEALATPREQATQSVANSSAVN